MEAGAPLSRTTRLAHGAGRCSRAVERSRRLAGYLQSNGWTHCRATALLASMPNPTHVLTWHALGERLETRCRAIQSNRIGFSFSGSRKPKRSRRLSNLTAISCYYATTRHFRPSSSSALDWQRGSSSHPFKSASSIPSHCWPNLSSFVTLRRLLAPALSARS
jgi:hypothetical protein